MKMKKIITFVFLQYCLHGLDLENISSQKKWNILQTDPSKIEWLYHEGFPIIRSSKVCDHNMHSLAELILDLENYPNIFKRVTSAEIISSNVVHITLDMPFPFAIRDYIVRFDIEKNDSSWTFSYSSVKGGVTDPKPGHVRLKDAAGMWKLKKISQSNTLITYTWNGQLLGNFPEFGLEKAWITQGNEVFYWLTSALAKRKNL